jgi:hypothetical protein
MGTIRVDALCVIYSTVYIYAEDGMDLDWYVRNPNFLRWISNAMCMSILMFCSLSKA